MRKVWIVSWLGPHTTGSKACPERVAQHASAQLMARQHSAFISERVPSFIAQTTNICALGEYHAKNAVLLVWRRNKCTTRRVFVQARHICNFATPCYLCSGQSRRRVLPCRCGATCSGNPEDHACHAHFVKHAHKVRRFSTVCLCPQFTRNKCIYFPGQRHVPVQREYIKTVHQMSTPGHRPHTLRARA